MTHRQRCDRGAGYEPINHGAFNAQVPRKFLTMLAEMVGRIGIEPATN